jgi:hypothetical protein
MASRKVEDYAYKYGLSNRQAKKRIGRARGDSIHIEQIARGTPVAGTGKGGKSKKSKAKT